MPELVQNRFVHTNPTPTHHPPAANDDTTNPDLLGGVPRAPEVKFPDRVLFDVRA